VTEFRIVIGIIRARLSVNCSQFSRADSRQENPGNLAPTLSTSILAVLASFTQVKEYKLSIRMSLIGDCGSVFPKFWVDRISLQQLFDPFRKSIALSEVAARINRSLFCRNPTVIFLLESRQNSGSTEVCGFFFFFLKVPDCGAEEIQFYSTFSECFQLL
jgi:hypothetical protein